MSSEDAVYSAALAATCDTLARGEFVAPRSWWVESDLKRFFVAALDELKSLHGMQAIESELAVPTPGWWAMPGNVDVAVHAKPGESASWDLFELKWKDTNKIAEALWDTAKLLSTFANPQVRNAYIITGAPSRYWNQGVAGTRCFEAGEFDTVELLTEAGATWAKILSGNPRARPRLLPRRMEIKPIFAREMEFDDGQYSLRAASVKPIGSAQIAVPSI